jgi:hypothetical protein
MKLKTMKTIKIFADLLLLTAICLIFFSCRNQLSDSSDFLIKVDSIVSPASVSADTAFDIEFYGTVGYDECTVFKTFRRIDNNNDIIIEAWATYDNKDGKCPPAIISLDGQKLNLTISLPGTYRILVNEPGDYTLIRQITVN